MVKVRVVDVDIPRKRISLSMRKDAGDAASPRTPARDEKKPAKSQPQAIGALGAALADALKKK